VRMVAVWHSVNDGVCVLCSDRDGKREGEWVGLPPLHVGCRCFLSYEPFTQEV
jgi:hypothetical protein